MAAFLRRHMEPGAPEAQLAVYIDCCNARAVAACVADGALATAPEPEFGELPLHRAALVDTGAVALELVRAGADPEARNVFGETASELARRCGNPRFADALDAGVPQPFSQAHAPLAELPRLLAEHADPLSPAALCTAVAAGEPRDLRFVLERSPHLVSMPGFRGMTALHVAAMCGNRAAVRELLMWGAAIDAKVVGSRRALTPAGLAYAEGHATIAAWLRGEHDAPEAPPSVRAFLHDTLFGDKPEEALVLATHLARRDVVRFLRRERCSEEQVRRVINAAERNGHKAIAAELRGPAPESVRRLYPQVPPAVGSAADFRGLFAGADPDPARVLSCALLQSRVEAARTAMAEIDEDFDKDDGLLGTPLHYAAEAADASAVVEMWYDDPSQNCPRRCDGLLPEEVADANGNTAVANLLRGIDGAVLTRSSRTRHARPLSPPPEQSSDALEVRRAC